jgi:tRNA threonylcarbamoyladenosine modification (KEOPS) complex Cgi121 subunit
MVRDRNTLTAEGTISRLLALEEQTANCGSSGSKCREIALIRAIKELSENRNIEQLFDMEMAARE